LGEIKGRRNSSSDSRQEERPAYACRTKKALAVNEGALGRQEENDGQKSSASQEKRCAHGCWTKKAFRADEGALGSKKESIEVASILKRLMPFVEG
jgi:hypothetical protein